MICRVFKDDKDDSDQLTCNTEKDKGIRLHDRTAGKCPSYHLLLGIHTEVDALGSLPPTRICPPDPSYNRGALHAICLMHLALLSHKSLPSPAKILYATLLSMYIINNVAPLVNITTHLTFATDFIF